MAAITTLALQQVNTIAILDGLNNVDVQFLATLIKEETPYTPVCVTEFFLQQFSTSDLSKILLSDEYRAKFQLPQKWHQQEATEVLSPDLFPFMVSEQVENGAAYHGLCRLVLAGNLQNLVAHVQAEAGQHKYRLRFFFVLICYYEFFNKNKPAPIIQQLFANPVITELLSVTGDEALVYQFFAKGPSKFNANAKFEIPEFLSSDVRQPGHQYDLSDCNFLVNVLAATMGSVPEKTHFYRSIFNLPSLTTKKMPGSTLNREFYDCGYKYLPDNKGGGGLESFPDIMNDQMRYRCLLNAFVWVPVFWGSVIFPEKFVENCKAVYHFMNYVRDEVRQNRSEYTTYREYATSRAFTFLTLFEQNEEGIQLKQNGKLFAVNVLDLYVRDQWKGENPALRDIFQIRAEVKPYEDYLLSLFTTVAKNYGEYKKCYQGVIQPGSPLQILSETQENQSKVVLNPVASLPQYQSFRAQHKGEHAEDEDDDDDKAGTISDKLSRLANSLDLL
eukprot:CAMPEP_0117042182 /NCGR_PEP_ID=MMETSP0472-20121206/29395_1 /TAXON_ID=693140 ORGANISM="Tiarina fusus, Strain LIS" /NCGR_SAMPLE_ID=MMETSP0472 /ASSEMBLY_ACC=CAM_ASM_000603 /LENGTH=501 /DNA_ID=CAMNT_0004753361 /DNA_START=684 /DNA_END=2186 /DNA_ORIENTATION=+